MGMFTKLKIFAMKTEYLNAPKKALETEIKIMNIHSPYFPKAYSYGETDDLIYLVLNLLGTSIRDIQRPQNDETTTEFVYNFSLQSLTTIERLHNLGYAHRYINQTIFYNKQVLNSTFEFVLQTVFEWFIINCMIRWFILIYIINYLLEYLYTYFDKIIFILN